MALVAALFVFTVHAQVTYTLKDPVITIDFGSGKNVSDFNTGATPVYQRVNETCPGDGFYSYANHTEDCFNNDWFTLGTDHTGGGNMMLVNANPTPGVFFTSTLTGLKPETTYQFAAFLMNVCRINGGCSPLPPQIAITITTAGGLRIASFKTGPLSQRSSPFWKKYAGFFTTPAGETNLQLTMSNLTEGDCGNDFALDDITIRERVEVKEETKPLAIEKPKPALQKTDTLKTVKPIVHAKMITPQKTKEYPRANENETDTEPAGIKKAESPLAAFKPVEEPKNGDSSFVQPPIKTIPPAIATRENPVVKTIITAAGQMSIDLYDNGQIDGDTVTIYHNNDLVVAGAALGIAPISFKIMVNAQHPHHEIVMVANNLGSIPPNTSLMRVAINGKQYDVFISSSEQQNAKVVVDLLK